LFTFGCLPAEQVLLGLFSANQLTRNMKTFMRLGVATHERSWSGVVCLELVECYEGDESEEIEPHQHNIVSRFREAELQVAELSGRL